MPLSAGTKLGAYEIAAAIGAGGMGEVYRARDTKLNRDVAIKVLPEAFARDAERTARLQREAKVLASLNHPNIAAIYGFEDSNGTHALVMELVGGPTLADRITQGPILIDEALRIAKQICEALEYAHERGIVHRDLKPANVKVTNEDAVKVLDFGLAKALDNHGTSIDSSNSPTMSRMATMQGVLLGTAAYMSPEQAKGKAVDRRADIWAFGCVLYEILTGRVAFGGETVTDTLAAVVMREPDWSQLLATTPVRVRVLLQRCLQKDPKQRLRDIGDARISLDEVLSGAPDVLFPGAAQPAKRWHLWLTAGLVGFFALTTVLLAYLYLNRRPSDQTIAKLSVLPPKETAVPSDSTPLISPDGSRLAFVARDSMGKSLLWVRPLDSLTSQPLAGTEDARQPFWSPDSRFLGFFSQDKLKKVDAFGGPPQVLCDVADNTLGGTWSREGTILFQSTSGQPLEAVSAAGGQPKPVLGADIWHSAHAGGQWFPYFLPDGRHFLFLAGSTKGQNAGVYVGAFDSNDTKLLLSVPSAVKYAAPGYLLFARDGTLMAQAFDASRLELSGDPFPLAEQVFYDPLDGDAMFSVSDNGVLAYRSGGISENAQLVWFDRSGKMLGSVGPPGEYLNPELSPDGKRVAFERRSAKGSRSIWLMDVSVGTARRFTFDPADDYAPVWAPDGSRIVFASNRDGTFGLYQKLANGSGDEDQVLSSAADILTQNWSSDGRFIIYRKLGEKRTTQVWALPLIGDRKPFPLLQSEDFYQSGPRLSPDGRWVAVYSNESGRYEVYIHSFQKPASKWQVSTNGGTYDAWSRDGKELFYLGSDGRLMAVAVKGDSALEVGTPRALFETHMFGAGRTMLGIGKQYDVAPDGQRFLLNVPVWEESSSPMNVVLNWTGELKK